MAEMKTFRTTDGKEMVEVFCNPKELLKTLHYQDPKAFDKIKEVDLTYDEYCLTFQLNKE